MSSTIHWIDIAVDHQALLKQFEYLNHMNPHTFEVDDLDRLIKSVKCLLYSFKLLLTFFIKVQYLVRYSSQMANTLLREML